MRQMIWLAVGFAAGLVLWANMEESGWVLKRQLRYSHIAQSLGSFSTYANCQRAGLALEEPIEVSLWCEGPRGRVADEIR
jgi:hypothetical protein